MTDAKDKLDIHDTEARIGKTLKRLQKNKYVSKEQYKKYERFVELCRLGKLGSKSGNHRVLSYIYNLNKLHNIFKKDLDKVSEKEFEKFYSDLSINRIKRDDGKSYKDNTKTELTKTIKRYLKFSYNDEKKFRKNVGWMKDFKQQPDIPALSLEETKKLADSTSNIRDKALILFLFDSGCRIEECLNLKFSNLSVKKNETGEYYVIDIKVTKTLPRKIAVPICSESLTEWIKSHPEKSNEQAYIFPIKYDWARIMLGRISKKTLKKKVTLHQLRHSSATYYCKKINNPVKFVYRYGWTINSDMARRYIDRSQLEDDAQEEIVNHVKNDKILEQEKQIEANSAEIKKLKEMVVTLINLADRSLNIGESIRDGKIKIPSTN